MHQTPSSIDLKIKISGEAGDGILTTGDILMTAASRLGYNSSVFKSFPANIRGGYSQAMVTISEQNIISPVSQSDILFLTNEISLKHDIAFLSNGNSLFIESSLIDDGHLSPKISQWQQSGITVTKVHIKKAARSVSTSSTIRSTVTLGYLTRLLQIPVELVQELITERFKSKGNDIVEQNLHALKAGILQAQTDIEPSPAALVKIEHKDDNRIILDGNQAISIGALLGGASFFASYPITPATSIGNYLSHYLPQNDGFAYQAEDEIAAIGAVIGASFSGAKAFTATSGPGLSLIQEFIGYASMVELPVVIVDVQRAGPSTGMSTKHSQDDLLAAAFGGHGEGQRIVLAPSGIQDSLFTTIEAFNISERYQCPVILLSDASMSMIKQTISYPHTDSIKITERAIVREWEDGKPFLRYKLNQTDTNPIAVPGISPVSYRVTGIEHDESSSPSVDADNREMQMKRRSEKMLHIEQDHQHLLEWDLETQIPYKADFTLIAWGLTASIARKAVYSMRQKGFSVAALYPKLLFPVLKQGIETLIKYSDTLFIPEANFTGQYSSIVRIYTDASPHPITISRDDPFTPEEIETYITARLQYEPRTLLS